MNQSTNTFLLLSALAGCSFTTAQAETIVQWGTSGGENDIVSPQQSFTVSDTYTVSNAVNPTVGASYYPNSALRTPIFNAAYGNAVGTRSAMVRDFDPDVIAIGMNTGTTAPGNLATNEVMVVWESSNFLSVSGSYTLDSITFEAKLHSDGSGASDLSVYRYILEDAAGNFHISQEFDQANDSSAYTTNSAAAGALTWSAYTPFSGGVDVIGAASSPNLTDFKAIGLYTAVADADDNWAQYQTRFFKADVTVASIAPITWDAGAGDDNWSSATNWDGDVAPVNGDSVVLTATAQSFLDYAWSIESGQSLTADSAVLTGNGYGDDFGIITGGSLTLASGGSMNIGFMRPRSDAPDGGDLIIEAGATLNTMVYGLSSKELNITYIADASGVTTWTNTLAGAGQFNIGGDTLTVDLSNYDVASGTTLVLVDYAAAGDLNGAVFASINLTAGWNGTIDYAYDQGGGDLAIALTNIAYQSHGPTSNGTPHSWLDLYGLVTGGDYAAADLLDSDSDGRLNWQEYQDGTDPTGVGVAAPIAFTLVDATDGSADTLTFSAPDTTWVIEASTDSVEWGVVPQVSFVVNADGTITATAPQLATLNSGGTYRVVETSENTKLVIFLTEGQSNMVGWSSKTSYEMDDYPTPNMFQQSRGQARLEYDPGAADSVVRAFQPFQTTQHRSGSTTGNYVSLDFYFARAYAKDHPDVDVLIVKNAIGGTGFVTNQWNAGDSLDVLADPYLAAALAEVSGEYATIEFGGILWHQGETDAATAASAAAYASNLTALFARHRAVVSSHFSGSEALVVIGTMVPANIANNSTGYYDDIDAIHRDISNLVANANFADLSNIVGEAGQHFLADGYQTAGELYYDTWLAMQGITGKGTSRAWLDAYGLVTGGDYAAADLLDSDSDGVLNWQEYLAGTNPTGAVAAITIPVAVSNGAPDVLNFVPPSTPWLVEATTDDTAWGVVPDMTFVVNDDGTIDATVDELPTLAAGGTYRITEIPQNNKLVIFLTEGQSNMAGYAPDAGTNIYGMADHPLPNMLQLSHGHARHLYDSEAENELIRAFQPLQASEVPGQTTDQADVALDFYFARAYAADHPDEDVLIIKNAYGGTGFANNRWNDGDSLDALVTPYFEGAFNNNDLSNRYATIEFGGILWHQGEADTKTVAASSAYASNLTAMIARHRSRVEAYVPVDIAPLILGTMQYYRIDNYYSNFPEMPTVDLIHRDIANLIPNASFVDLHDLQGTTQIHFTIDEYKTAGARYYQKWLELKMQRASQNTWLDLYGLVTAADYAAADLLDSDSDGKFNWQEYQYGTNPAGHLPTESPVLELQVGGIGSDDSLTFTPPNTAWVLKVSDTLEQWDDVSDAFFTTNADGSITVNTEHDAGLSKRFYRMVEIGF